MNISMGSPTFAQIYMHEWQPQITCTMSPKITLQTVLRTGRFEPMQSFLADIPHFCIFSTVANTEVLAESSPCLFSTYLRFRNWNHGAIISMHTSLGDRLPRDGQPQKRLHIHGNCAEPFATKLAFCLQKFGKVCTTPAFATQNSPAPTNPTTNRRATCFQIIAASQ